MQIQKRYWMFGDVSIILTDSSALTREKLFPLVYVEIEY